MSNDIRFKSQQREFNSRPMITSYDSGFEHSLEHWLDLRCMVDRQQDEDNLADEHKQLAATA
jgi:hypothetical protein